MRSSILASPFNAAIFAWAFFFTLMPSTIEADIYLSEEQKDRVKKVVDASKKVEKITSHFVKMFETLRMNYEKEKADVVNKNKSKLEKMKADLIKVKASIIKKCEKENKEKKTSDSSEEEEEEEDAEEEEEEEEEALIAECLEEHSKDIQKKIAKKAKDTADDVAEKQQKILEKHISDLVKLEMEGISKEHEVEDELLHFVINLERDPLFVDIDGVFHDERKGIEYQLKCLSDAQNELSKEIAALKNILYGMVCFQFTGVYSPIHLSSRSEFNEVAKTSLELAFADEEMDVTVVATEIMKQKFMPEGDKPPLPSPPPHRHLRERQLRRRWGTLSVKSVVGFQCSCETDSLNHDVYHRGRDLSELISTESSSLSEQEFQRRGLSEKNLEEDIAEMMKEVFYYVNEEEYSVSTVPCADVGL